MHPLLAKVLAKKNIKEVKDLSMDDKLAFDNWQRILSTEEITVDKIKGFCENQIKVIEGQWKDLNNSHQKNERLILSHNVYSTLLNVILSPQKERENLEKYLIDLLK